MAVTQPLSQAQLGPSGQQAFLARRTKKPPNKNRETCIEHREKEDAALRQPERGQWRPSSKVVPGCFKRRVLQGSET